MEYIRKITGDFYGFPTPVEDRMNEISRLEDRSDVDEQLDILFDALIRNYNEKLMKALVAGFPTTLLIQENYSLTDSHITRLKRLDRNVPTPFGIDICYRLLRSSCQEAVFGTRSQIIIPNEIAAVIWYYESGKIDRKRLSEVTEAYETYVLKPSYPLGLKDSYYSSDIYYSRIQSLQDDLGYGRHTLLRSHEWITASNEMNKIFHIRQMDTSKPVQLATFLKSSVKFNCSVDFLMARDYTPFSDLYFINGEQELYKADDEDYRKMLSVYLRLPEERKTAFCTDLYFGQKKRRKKQ